MAGVSRMTILRHVKKGKLSATVDDNGHKRFDTAELARVYATAVTVPHTVPRDRPAIPAMRLRKSAAGASADSELVDTMRRQIERLEADLERLRSDLEQERDERRRWADRYRELADRYVRRIEGPTTSPPTSSPPTTSTTRTGGVLYRFGRWSAESLDDIRRGARSVLPPR